MPTTQQLEAAKRIYVENLSKAAMFNMDVATMASPKVVHRADPRLRTKLYEYPIIPGAAWVFQQLVSSREWVISGSPRMVPQVIEFFNKSQVINLDNGMTEFGLENVLKRMALDYISLGRMAFGARKKKGEFVFEYFDPAYLSFERTSGKHGYENPVTEAERVWRYADMTQLLPYRSVKIHHPLPIGATSYLAPLSFLLPVANLAYLVQQHDTASLDGRKIRDIILVGSTSMANAIENAMSVQWALWNGSTPEEVGIPIIEVNNASGQPLENNIAKLGLSEIPEAFNRVDFIFYYVNQIAAVFGLALRHFWNDERTTNKALEVVQEQRQQQKGPASFVRTVQRLINQTGYLEEFKQAGKLPRFAFIEEVDTNSLLERAEVVKRNAEALERVAGIFGTYIEPESYLAWMQDLGVFPYELRLAEREVEAANPDKVTAVGDKKIQVGNSEPLVSTNPSSTAKPSGSNDANRGARNPADNFRKDVFPIPDYGEIVMNGQGEIVERRRKVFGISEILRPIVAKELEDLPDFTFGS